MGIMGRRRRRKGMGRRKRRLQKPPQGLLDAKKIHTPPPKSRLKCDELLLDDRYILLKEMNDVRNKIKKC